MKLRLGCALVLAWCTACSSVPADRTFSLVPTDPGTFAEVPTSIAVRVETPAYLDSRSIVLAAGPHELSYATHHLWSEPLDQGFARALLRELEHAALPGELSSVDVRIERFHGSLAGSTVLEAVWSLGGVDPSGERVVGWFAATQQQEGVGFGSLLQAQHALIRRLAQTLGERSRELL